MDLGVRKKYYITLIFMAMGDGSHLVLLEKVMVIVFDIDGTLADIEKRLLKAGDAPKKKNKKEFQAWLNKLQKKKDLLDDEVIKGMPTFARCLAHRFTTVYITGRAEKYRETTVMWLFKNLFPSGDLYMHP